MNSGLVFWFAITHSWNPSNTLADVHDQSLREPGREQEADREPHGHDRRSRAAASATGSVAGG